MSSLRPAPAFEGLRPVGQGGGVRVRLVQPTSLLSVLAQANKAELVIERARHDLGIELEDGPRQSSSGNTTALGVGPSRWLFITDVPEKVSEAFSGIASLAEHTDGYAVFAVSGERVRDALAKGIPIDSDPAIFDERAAVVTVIAHIGAIVWKNTMDEFCIAVFRSYAESLWNWLAASAAEYGLETR
jgi:methylglutamate dehydrogenase subunit D